MKRSLYSTLLASLFFASPVFGKQAVGLSPRQAQFATSVAGLLKRPVVGDMLKAVSSLESLSMPEFGEAGQVEGMLIEVKPEVAGALFRTLEESAFVPELLDGPYLNEETLARFVDLVRKTEQETEARYDRLVDEIKADAGDRRGADRIATPGVYALKERVEQLHADRIFLSEAKRKALPGARVQIGMAVRRYDRKVHAFNDALVRKVEAETLDAVYDNWFYRDPLLGTWHTQNTGAAVAFESPEEALEDQIQRLEAAPKGPWLKPIVASVHRALKQGEVVADPDEALRWRRRLAITQGKIEVENDVRRERLGSAIEGWVLYEMDGEKPSLAEVETLFREVRELRIPMTSSGEYLRLDKGIKARINAALWRGGHFEDFPAWNDLSEYWSARGPRWNRAFLINLPVFKFLAPLSFLVGMGVAYANLISGLLILGVVGLYLAFYRLFFLPKWEIARTINSLSETSVDPPRAESSVGVGFLEGD